MPIIYEGSTRVKEIIALIEKEFNMKQNNITTKFNMKGDNRVRSFIKKEEVRSLVAYAKKVVIQEEEARIKRKVEETLQKDLAAFRNKVERI